MAYELTNGVRKTALKVVVYGPEGIGKSTLAAEMPSPVFVDVEGGTNQLPVSRLPRPTSWSMLMDEVRAVRDGEVPCSTIVIDTADAAERLCTAHVCSANGKGNVEDFGYGKGYVFVRDEWGRLLDLLSEVVERGRNVVITGHSWLRKFERPDESGAYDRYEMKLSKYVAPITKEWCDLLLFCDYDVIVSEDSKTKKAKAHGGRRVIRTEHTVTWDAKNRFGLPETMPLDMASAEEISALMAGTVTPVTVCSSDMVTTRAETESQTAPPHRDDSPEDAYEPPTYPARLKPLADLMAAGRVTDAELRHVVGQRGDFTEDCPVENYKQDFVDFLISQWDGVVRKVEINRIPVPFSETEPEDRS